MGDLQFPWAAWMEAQRQKNQNQQDTFQNIAGMGQGIGNIAGGIGSVLEHNKWQQTIAGMMKDPNLTPQFKALLPAMEHTKGLMGQLGPELMKPAPKPPNVWRDVPGKLSKKGFPLLLNEANGEEKEGPIEATATAGLGSPMANERHNQFAVMQVPSNQGVNTAGGAAFQVKVAARQGKALIAKAGSAQRTALASGDMARTVLRNSPTDEALRNANFSNNSITQWNILKQKLTANPKALYNSEIRKEMFNIFDEMDKSATPWIKDQLDLLEYNGYHTPEKIYRKQLGLDIPDIPFEDDPTPNPSFGQAAGANGWGIQKVQ